MKKLLSLFIIVAILFSMSGCSASAVKEGLASGGSGDVLDSFSDMITNGGDFKVDAEAEGSEMMDSMSPEEGEAVDGGTSQNVVVAGTLTAGEWKDSENIEFWTKLLNRNDWYQYMELRNLFPTKIVTVNVRDKKDNPCYNVEVALIGGDGQTAYAARTDINGNAYLLYDINNSKEIVSHVRVGEQTLKVTDDNVVNVVAEDAGVDIKALDLMLMVDTTGSMGDELKYIQKELEDVIKRVAEADESLSINVSVNFYRDDTDEYVVRSFEFTDNIEKILKQLKKQETDGGGDYPEAVHTALNNVVNEHQWREDAVKLCFFILDAPPHKEAEINGIDSQLQSYVRKAAAEGIRIIPVASSGVDTETEFLMRSYALMTGGTYVFLTNHSGIGGDHLEPTIGEYEVEALNELMIRVVSEYCGLKYTRPSAQQ